jgi:Rhodanese-like domain
MIMGRKTAYLLITTLFAIGLIVIGCQTAANNTANNTPKGTAAPTDNTPRISLADAKAAFDAAGAIFIDSRPESQYKLEHVAGALSLPIGSPEAKFDTIEKGKKIIVYCS